MNVEEHQHEHHGHRHRGGQTDNGADRCQRGTTQHTRSGSAGVGRADHHPWRRGRGQGRRYSQRAPCEPEEGQSHGDTPCPQQPGVAALDVDPFTPRFERRKPPGRSYPEQPVAAAKQLRPEVVGQVEIAGLPAVGNAIGPGSGQAGLDDRPQQNTGQGCGRNRHDEGATETAGEETEGSGNDEKRDGGGNLARGQTGEPEETGGGRRRRTGPDPEMPQRQRRS